MMETPMTVHARRAVRELRWLLRVSAHRWSNALTRTHSISLSVLSWLAMVSRSSRKAASDPNDATVCVPALMVRDRVQKMDAASPPATIIEIVRAR